jgi:hypothetical protein
MTDRFLTEPADILAAMRACVGRDTPSSLAIAFWGRGAATSLGLANAAPSTRILLNAPSGACNPSELTRLLEEHSHINVRSSARLHAKVAIGADRMLVGSANASANGLGFDGDALIGWNEACTVVEDRRALSAAGRWFQGLWDAAEPLTPALIREAIDARARLERHAHRLADQIGSPTVLPGSGIFVVLTDEDSDIDEAEAKRAVEKHGGNRDRVDFYQAWSSMPNDAILIDFAWEGTKASHTSVWTSNGQLHTIRLKHGKIANPVFATTPGDRGRFGLPSGSMAWGKSVNAVVELLRDNKLRSELRRRGAQCQRATDWCMPLDEFLALCTRHGRPVPKPWDAIPTSSFQYAASVDGSHACGR